MTEASTKSDMQARIKEILRRDLKLGPDARIDDDMPLFNSDADLDSLDMLLLVSSIEREFGFRIPNEAVGAAVFQSVETLASYVHEHRGEAAAPVTGPKPVIVNPLDRLPHAEPFRFVTKLNKLIAGDSVEAVWGVTGTEAFFAGHFPGRPIVPGVLIAEALAQVSGLIQTTEIAPRQGMLAHIDVRFDEAVQPPASIVLRSRITRSVGALQQFEVVAEADGRTVAHGTLALHLSGDEAR